MKNLVSDLAAFSRIAIFGFGKEGRSFYDFALKYLPNATLCIVDKNTPQDIEESEKVVFFSGDDYLKGLEKVDLVIKSPGVSLYNLGIKYDAYNFSSTTELFIKHFKKQIIGVTGTKGKSTLVTIIDQLLKNAKQETVLCGNIGTPAFDIVQEITPTTRVVMELSSHQLLNIKHSPHIAILTNLFEEHLDYYKDLQEYYDAKFNILHFQNENDILIVNLQEPYKELNASLFQTKSVYNVFEHTLKYDVTFDVKQGFIHKSSLQILEKLVELLKIDKETYLKTIKEFKTLPHRLEYVDTIEGVIYINDSISTIPEATMEAVKILKNVESLILGGFDRGIHYDSLVEYLLESDIQNIVLFSDTGKKIFESLSKSDKNLNIFYVTSLSQAVEKVHQITESGIALFSPAASSFNEYKNFMQRGDEFKSLVIDYKQQEEK
ncbi:UDP-N-acetylmuramoyl-L-alanine--D-glutamate ligase [Sulfurimonas aquatica]|uniref:UDP-N-acetylmuramoyl-L-alanine--D-glutamate ligase n=1 Tax=Sulfurimonas aquatica TaxID=2672570 RepID=UPI001A99C86F|nr:UDP-N-acetylmuramoyl-L-alanine--D-glutamate ligase [Sulfurimonas aquatica]